MKIDKDEIKNIDLSFFDFDILNYPYLKDEREHYRLLVYLTNRFNNIKIIDAGTNNGHSCLSLAQNKKNTVITYDLFDKSFPFFDDYPNIIFKKMDINLEDSDELKSCKLILLDIDPHDGIQETTFTNKLKDINYKGLVICDDIHLNIGMRNWWGSLDVEKYDLTDVGHMSGTGMLVYR